MYKIELYKRERERGFEEEGWVVVFESGVLMNPRVREAAPSLWHDATGEKKRLV